MDLQSILEKGESVEIEFKSEKRGPLSDNDIVEAAVCLANRNGGFLLIGVEDDGTVTGACPYPREEKGINPEKLRAMIFSRTSPGLWTKVWVEEIEGKQIIIIEVPKALVTATSYGKYLTRILGGDGRPSCVPLYPHELISILSEETKLDVTARTIELNVSVIDEEAIDHVWKLCKGRNPDLEFVSRDELLRILGAVTPDGKLTLAGLLFLGKKEAIHQFIPHHEVILSVFKASDLVSQKRFISPLSILIFELIDEISKYNRGIGEVIKNGVRYEVPLFGMEVIREILANALVHRDYMSLGAISIEIHMDGRLRVNNPGGFVRGVTVHNLLSTPPRPRNPLLAEMFRITGIVERTGRGIDKVYLGQAVYGKPLPLWNVTESSVSVTIIGSEWERQLTEILINEELAPEEVLIVYHSYFKQGISVKDLAGALQRSSEEVEFFIQRLQSSGFLQREGDRVFLSKTRINVQELIISILKEKGPLSRSEISKFSGENPSKVYRILKKLLEMGIVRRQGKGKNTFYTLQNSR